MRSFHNPEEIIISCNIDINVIHIDIINLQVLVG